jgi:outer membrane immunogenic protein
LIQDNHHTEQFMRILTGAALGALGLALASTPALAQDKEFSGPYIGGSVGYGFQGNDAGESIEFDRDLNGTFGDTVTTAAPANAFSPGFCNGRATSSANGSCTNDKDAIEYHARLGWDFQFGNVVVGLVAEGGKSEISDSVSGFSTTPASYTLTRELDWNASVRARAGYAFGGKTLFYATGGPSYARINNSFTTSNVANKFSDNGKSEAWGWQAGGGVEQKIGKHLSLGVEYLYSKYEDDEYRVRAASTGTTAATNPFLLGNVNGTDFRRSDTDFDFHAIRATAAFRF